jgi:hypothetical protein
MLMMAGRNVLTEHMQSLAKAFLDREITVCELRLYFHLSYTMQNGRRLSSQHMNERKVLSQLRKEGHIKGGARGLKMTFQFWTYIHTVLWFGYADHDGKGRVPYCQRCGGKGKHRHWYAQENTAPTIVNRWSIAMRRLSSWPRSFLRAISL